MPRHALPSLAPPPTHTRAHAAPCPPLLAACACYLAAHSIDQADWPFYLLNFYYCRGHLYPPSCTHATSAHTYAHTWGATMPGSLCLLPGTSPHLPCCLAILLTNLLSLPGHLYPPSCTHATSAHTYAHTWGGNHARELVSAAWHSTPFTMLPGHIYNKISNMAVAT